MAFLGLCLGFLVVLLAGWWLGCAFCVICGWVVCDCGLVSSVGGF